MKILSVAIPCYNSAAYMEHCIETLLVGGDDVEILIVDDGSSDDTAKIADSYAAKYPSIIKAIHQENGGHGEAVNAGIRNATGIYYKVVDSDDWVDKDAYLAILSRLRDIHELGSDVDMFISNYVYEKDGAKHKKVISYSHVLPQEKIFTWDEVGHFKKGQYILMHSVIYRLALLKECKLELPKHTFYVDNIFVFNPLPYVKTMYYLNVDFYRYFIGRNDQSVNESVMIKRIDQQLRVNKLMIDYMAVERSMHKRVKAYMLNYLDIITTVSSIMLILSGTAENLQKKAELIRYIKNTDAKLYRRLRYSLLGCSMNLPGKLGRKIAVGGYKVAHKIIGFN